MKRILVFRFSAMGDVAMTMTALKKVILENPDIKIYYVTRKKFFPFFQNYPQIELINADFENTHKSFKGLLSLFKTLKEIKPDVVIDLHQNIRTSVLKSLFALKGIKSYTLDKGRSDKKALVQNKIFKPLKSGTERYLDVFKNAGIIKNTNFDSSLLPIFKLNTTAVDKISRWIIDQNLNDKELIGIAPFTQHKSKIWPIEKFESLIKQLAKDKPNAKIILFGGGKTEKEVLDKIATENKNCISIVHQFSLEEELALIAKLNCMISGDSSNMHLAAMSGIKTLSIWGATHPYAGFAPIFQPKENQIQISKEKLPCRPCSVYGNKDCARGDYACLEWIGVEDVLEKI